MKLLIEGKAKKIFLTKDKSTLIQYFKDDATAFNNKKRKQFKSKGILNNSISALIFKYLNENRIKTHFIKKISEREQIIKKVKIIPLEVVVRNYSAGSISDKFKINYENKLPNGKIYDFLSKNYQVAISGLIVSKDLLEKINFFNKEFNIIGDFDAVMKISKIEEAHVIQKPLLSIRIHGENFSDRHRKMSFKEFKKWYFFQERDSFFNKNKDELFFFTPITLFFKLIILVSF